MTVRKVAAQAAMAALAAAFMLGATGVSEAKKKAAPKAPAAKEWCKWDYAPVCGTVAGKKQTFSNACFAKENGAKKIKKGVCK
jgi:hypothetical protein